MAVNLLLYQIYKDGIWNQRFKDPMNEIQFVLFPHTFFQSDKHVDWSVCSIAYPSDMRLPVVGNIICLLQFESGIDSGEGYNLATAVSYKSLKYGRKYDCENKDPTFVLDRKKFTHDQWEEYKSLPDKLNWTIGDINNRFILEILADKMEPIELFKNYETCMLYIYKPMVIKFHMDKETANKIKEGYAQGKGLIKLSPELIHAASADTSAENEALIMVEKEASIVAEKKIPIVAENEKNKSNEVDADQSASKEDNINL